MANPRLAELLDEAIGSGWRRDLEQLSALEPLLADGGFLARWQAAESEDERRALAAQLQTPLLQAGDVFVGS